MDDPTTWGLIWLAAAFVFATGEILMAGGFFLIPFAIGGLAASIAGFAGAPVWATFIIFIVVALATFAALRPVARRLDAAIPEPVGAGANRLVGLEGVVTTTISNLDDQGSVRVGSESWRAESSDGLILTEGQLVNITEVRGTRVVVQPMPPS